MNEPTDLRTENRCPLCGAGLLEEQVRNSLSRIDNRTYICNRCGTAEALMQRPSAGRPRECLYFDEAMGVALVTEGEAGYTPLFSGPEPRSTAANEWLARYTDRANERIGYSRDTVMDIVISSMRAQGVFQ